MRKGGAAVTAKKVGLWKPTAAVSREQIKHMHARVVQFSADAVLLDDGFETLPKCGESFARCLTVASALFASRPSQRVR